MATSLIDADSTAGEVSFSEAEATLGKMWTSDEEGRQRVCTLNLLIAGPGSGIDNEQIEALTPVISAHPARIMVIQACDGEGDPGVIASVACRRGSERSSGGVEHVCWEELLIQ